MRFVPFNPCIKTATHGNQLIIIFALQIKRSQHAFINPSITIILRMGSGGHGVPPLGNPDGAHHPLLFGLVKLDELISSFQNGYK